MPRHNARLRRLELELGLDEEAICEHCDRIVILEHRNGQPEAQHPGCPDHDPMLSCGHIRGVRIRVGFPPKETLNVQA
jgi:hypothetical protein